MSGIFLYLGYLSCDGRERKRVGKLFDAITLRVYETKTNKYKKTLTPYKRSMLA